MVAGDCMVGEAAQQVLVAGGRGVLEAAHPQVAAGHPGQHGARQCGFAIHRAAGADHGQRPCRRDAQRVHRLADDVFAQHRSDGRQAVPAPGERCGSGAFQVDVAQPPVCVDELAEEQRAPVAQSGTKPPN